MVEQAETLFSEHIDSMGKRVLLQGDLPIGDPPNYADMPGKLREERFPNRWELDSVAPNNPVYIRGIWTPWNVPPSVSIANSTALRLAGIDRETLEPDSSVTIDRDAAGEPTGIFIDSARFPSVGFTLMKAVPRFTRADRVEALRESMKLYNSVGTTGTYEGHGVAPKVLVAINLNDRIHYHMHREGKPLGSPNEEVTNLIPSFSRAPNPPIPDRIFSEKASDAVSVVIIVTVRAITRFKPLYLLDVLYCPKPTIDVLQGHVLPPPFRKRYVAWDSSAESQFAEPRIESED